MCGVAGLTMPGVAHRLLHRALERLIAEVVPAHHARARIARPALGREHVLPAPFARRARDTCAQARTAARRRRIRRADRAVQLRARARAARAAAARAARQHRHAVLRPLPSRTRISRRAKSTSFTRSRTHSMMRMPGAVEQPRRSADARRAGAPSTRATSSRVSTTGAAWALGPLDALEPRQLALQHFPIEEQHRALAPDSASPPRRYARRPDGQECLDLRRPQLSGWRLPWNTMKRLIQST